MKTILILLLIVTVSFTKPFLSCDGQAGDVWHVSGSALGTLAIEKYFDTDWATAAGFMLMIGFTWEACDAIFHRGIFDPAGFDIEDIYRNALGVTISFPLSGDCKLGYRNKQFCFSYRF